MIWIIVAVYIVGFVVVYGAMYKNAGWFDRAYSGDTFIIAALFWPVTIPLALIVGVIECVVDRMEEKK